MPSLLAFARSHASESDALLVEQFAALRRQIPLMYALTFIDTFFLAFVTSRDAPLPLSLGMPGLLVILAAARSVIWYRRRHHQPSLDEIRHQLRATLIAAAVLGCAFGSWGLLLYNETDHVRSSVVALYIFVGAIGCCYCLQTLPNAGRLVLLCGALPVTVRLIISPDWYLAGIGINFLVVAAVILRTLSTNYAGFVAVVTSRSEMLAEKERARQAEQTAQQLAYHDPLTGLANRRALGERLDEAIEGRPPDQALALLLLDLDLFKGVNDVHGHPAGDRLLKAVSDRLGAAVSGIGTPYRLGGDEFAVTLPLHQRDRDTAREVAKRIVSEFAAPFLVEGLTHHIGASVGISVFPQDATDRETLMRRADIALYKAKAQGRSRYQAFEERMDAEITERSILEQQFRRDLVQGAFRPFYQPIVALRSGKITGFEMLARWERRDGRHVGPDKFIPVAEECGLIGDLMLRLLEQACREASSWGPDVILSFNVSPVQLKDPWLAERILEVLDRTGFSPRRLTMEITENALIVEPENAKRIVSMLKRHGMQLALDDFGTGFSSICHLRMLPFDKLKIDRSFIEGIERNVDANNLVVALLGLAASLNLTVIAEGIESSESLAMLGKLGCTEGQGYRFGRPMSATDAARLLRFANASAA